MKNVEYYKQKYSIGLIDVSNSLETYNSFLRNLGIERTLEEFVEQQLRFSKKIRVLDIGCGNAGALQELKKKFGNKIETVGMDLVSFSKQNSDRPIIGNALNKKFPSNCTLVFSFRSLHEIGHSPELVSKACEALSKHGIALLAFRLHSISKNATEWEGEMTHEDEQFLFSILEHKKFQKCTVSGKIAFETISNSARVPTGILLKIEKK